jgi:hypothetical protein
MPFNAVTIREDVIEKSVSGAGHDMVVRTQYEAPAETDTEWADDQYKDLDLAVAANVMKWLNQHYPGHLWGVVCDTQHRIVKFNIPILMGFDQWFVINLRTHDIVDGLKLGAGQVLERYRLRRGKFNLAEFLDAREKHSRLVHRTRPVPE